MDESIERQIERRINELERLAEQAEKLNHISSLARYENEISVLCWVLSLR